MRTITAGSGEEALARIEEQEFDLIETAVTALRRGACDYLEKPLSLDDLNLRGAFTPAVQANPGLFVAANRGTLLLDEIGV